MKKILLISLQKKGAAPLDTLGLSDALSDIGAAHTLIISQGNELKSQFTDGPFRKVISVRTFKSTKRAFISATLFSFRPMTLYRAIKKERPDVIVSSHFHPWLLLVLLYAKMNRVPWRYSAHESPFWNKEGRGAAEQSLEISFLKSADGIFCYSDFIASNLKKNLPGKKIVPLHVGPYVLKDPSPHASSAGLPEKKHLRIICVGRIELHKGIGMLLASHELLQAKSPVPHELVIAGAGALPASFRLDPNLHIINRWIALDEIRSLYASADIVAIPYAMASQSASPAWAMAYGLPSVTTDAGGLPEQIQNGENGIVVPNGGSEAFSDALKILLEDGGLRTAMGASAAHLGEGAFSWKKTAEHILQVLNARA